MKALARLEQLIQDVIERPAWLLSQRRMHPIELAQALTRAMESAALPLADRVIVPDTYTLRLSPDDFDQLGGVRRTLEREYAAYVERLAQERDLTLGAPARVTLISAAEVRAGAVEVATAFTEEPAPAARGTIATRLGAAPAEPDVTEVVRPRRAVAGAGVLELLGADGRVRRRVALDGAEAVIGRRTASDVSLADPEVSRRHARVELTASGYYVHDLGSMNGTLVNGRKIAAPHALEDGDVIEIGQSRLRFRLQPVAAAGPV